MTSTPRSPNTTSAGSDRIKAPVGKWGNEGFDVDLSDDLLCLYTARLEERDGGYSFDVPESELELGDLDEGGVYRVAVLPKDGGSGGTRRERRSQPSRAPPVEEGDVRQVTIEGLGDQGDGIARVDRGYVVIVPGTDVGDEVEIEIRELHDNFAMGRVVGRSEESSDLL